MIVGESVTVRRQTVTGTDPGGGPIYGTPTTETVYDVLVSPGPREDVVDSNRPDGTRIAWTLHFPKTYSSSLRGAEISVRGGAFRPVVGDPQHYTEANTPGAWSMPVELEAVDG